MTDLKFILAVVATILIVGSILAVKELVQMKNCTKVYVEYGIIFKSNIYKCPEVNPWQNVTK